MSLETDLLGAAVDVVESQRKQIAALNSKNLAALNALKQAYEWTDAIGDDTDWKYDQLDKLAAAISAVGNPS